MVPYLGNGHQAHKAILHLLAFVADMLSATYRWRKKEEEEKRRTNFISIQNQIFSIFTDMKRYC